MKFIFEPRLGGEFFFLPRFPLNCEFFIDYSIFVIYITMIRKEMSEEVTV